MLEREMDNKRSGLIGRGLMGIAMPERLLEHGFVVIWFAPDTRSSNFCYYRNLEKWKLNPHRSVTKQGSTAASF